MSERVESDNLFPPNDEATLVTELQRVQNQSALQDSMNSNDRPHSLVNYSFTDDSDEKSELIQSNGDTTDDEDIPQMSISLVRWLNKRFRVSDNISSFY